MGTKRASPKSIFEWKCPLFLYLYMYWVLKCKLFILFLSFYKPPSEGTNGGGVEKCYQSWDTTGRVNISLSCSACFLSGSPHDTWRGYFYEGREKSMIEWLRGTTATYKRNCCHIDFSCISLIHVVIHENVILFPCIFKIFLIF